LPIERVKYLSGAERRLFRTECVSQIRKFHSDQGGYRILALKYLHYLDLV